MGKKLNIFSVILVFIIILANIISVVGYEDSNNIIDLIKKEQTIEKTSLFILFVVILLQIQMFIEQKISVEKILSFFLISYLCIKLIESIHFNWIFFICMLLIWVFALNKIYYKKNRQFDRVFVFGIYSSVVVTSLIFYIVMPMSIFKHEKYEEEKQMENKMLILSTDAACKISDQCIILENNKYKNLNKEEISNQIKKGKKVFTIQNNDGQYMTVGVIKENNVTELLLNNKNLNYYHLTTNMFFYFLCACAHTIWLFGGLFLLSWHRKRFKNKKEVKNAI